MTNIILVGGGGHCKSCIDVIEETNLYSIKGIIDLPEMIGKKILSYPIIGSDNDLKKLVDRDTAFLISVGQMVASSSIKQELFSQVSDLGAFLPSICSSHAYVSKHASLGRGSIIFSGSIVNAEAKIGDNCIINSGSVIEHDVVIGDHTHISTASTVNGNVSIGKNCFIASGSTIRNGISICDDVLIGMGSVVTKGITESGTYLGNPAKLISN